MAWRVARALDQLLAQINALAPNRSKASDGSIGDTRHAASKSDHNPDADGVVHARDITHDPGHGADMHVIAEQLRRGRDSRIKYVIFNRRYFSPRTGWMWAAYSGDSPHDHHMHVSVVAGAAGDDTRAFALAGGGTSSEELSVGASDIVTYEIRPWAAETRQIVGRLEAQLAALKTVVEALASAFEKGGGSIDTAAVLKRIDDVAARESETVASLQAKVDDLTARLAKAGQALG